MEAPLVAVDAAIGVAAAPGFAAVILFRLIAFWLPILPGWMALVTFTGPASSERVTNSRSPIRRPLALP